MLLTNGFRPDPRVAKEAEALSDAGYDVTVLAWDRERKYPLTSEHGPVHIARIRTGWAGSMLSMALRYPLFFVRALIRGLRTDADVIHAHDFDTLVLGFLLSRLKGVPVVFDAHEHYGNMVATDLPRWVADLTDRLEAFFVRRADLVVTVSEGHAAYLRPNARTDVVIVENCVDIPAELERTAHDESELVLFYAGTLEPMRYIEESISVAKGIPGCVYKVAGFGRLEGPVRQQAADGRVRFLGYLPHAVMMKEMASSDVVLCLLDPANKNYKVGSPNKLYEAMAVGVPVLTSKDTLSGDIVEREGCGLAIEWSEDRFREAIAQLREPNVRRKMGEAGRKAAESKYNWPVMRDRLLEGYRRIKA
jgi:glycosyltransferase involved in cell wall biosynthesis